MLSDLLNNDEFSEKDSYMSTDVEKMLLDDNPYLNEMLESKTEIISLKENNYKIPIPSTLRISTMTAVCNINCNINLNEMYKCLTFNNELLDNYIESCQFSDLPIKGTCFKKKPKKHKQLKKKNCFQNQATLIVVIEKEKRVNMKIFRNGKIQMTGLKSEQNGYTAVNVLIDVITEIIKTNPLILNIEPDNNTCLDIKKLENTSDTEIEIDNTPSISVKNNEDILYISEFSIVLINSDYSSGFKVKREKLYEILFNENIYVSYEPDIYPGVNAKYYWNSNNNNGICKCKKACNGKGDGSGDGKCKKITIATFQSGNVIITGARNFKQTMDAYAYINNLFKINFNSIVRSLDSQDENSLTKSKKNSTVRVNIDNIINWNTRNTLLELNI